MGGWAGGVGRSIIHDSIYIPGVLLARLYVHFLVDDMYVRLADPQKFPASFYTPLHFF